MAPPIRFDVETHAWAGPRLPGGNHRVITRAALGRAPASPAPKRKRMSMSNTKLLNKTRVVPFDSDSVNPQLNLKTHPVSAVKADHQSTMRINTRRDPNRSPQCPVMTSNSP